ncbi:MAG: universal stress protein [Alphaproteobacteria bacterium]|nr:universal stress protein [Alphaproteobacteria bacterium]
MTDVSLPKVRNLLAVCAADRPDSKLLAQASALAQVWEAELTVLTVIDPPSDIEQVALEAGMSKSGAADRLSQEIRAGFRDVLGPSLADLTERVEIRFGKPFLEIIRFVRTHNIDLVMKTAEPLDGLAGPLLGSTDQHLLRKCPCPLWIRRPDSPLSLKTVIAAVDIDDGLAAEPETLAGLNRRLLESAADLARIDGADIHVLHAWDAPAEGLVRMWSGSADRDQAAARYVGQVETSHWQALRDLVGNARSWLHTPAGPVALRPHLVRGEPATVIPREVDALGADLLVMGTVARTGIPGLLIGNTAEDILNSVDCAILTIKPPGFVSPIEI